MQRQAKVVQEDTYTYSLNLTSSHGVDLADIGSHLESFALMLQLYIYCVCRGRRQI